MLAVTSELYLILSFFFRLRDRTDLNCVPDHVLLNIFSYLSVRSLCQSSQVSFIEKSWKWITVSSMNQSVLLHFQDQNCIELSRLQVFLIDFGVFGKCWKNSFLGKCNWYSSYNFFQLYDYNHQVCHRWRFLTKDVRLWKDKIAALGKPVNCFILVVHLKVHVTNQVLLPNLCYVNKVT